MIVPYDRTLTITHVEEIIYRSYGRSNKNSIYTFFSKIIIFKMEFFQTEFPVFFENQVSWTMGFSFQLAHLSCVHRE